MRWLLARVSCVAGDALARVDHHFAHVPLGLSERAGRRSQSDAWDNGVAAHLLLHLAGLAISLDIDALRTLLFLRGASRSRAQDQLVQEADRRGEWGTRLVVPAERA